MKKKNYREWKAKHVKQELAKASQILDYLAQTPNQARYVGEMPAWGIKVLEKLEVIERFKIGPDEFAVIRGSKI